MRWTDIRKAYPDQWLIIEALEAQTTPDSHRQLDQIAVVETCSNGQNAMQRYRDLHRQYPLREFYFVNTLRETLDIVERQWAGVRRNHAVGA